METQYQQLDLFSDMGLNKLPEIPSLGKQLRDAGMQTSTDHANAVIEKWSDRAYELLLKFVERSGEFLCEDFRAYCNGKIETPPSKRSFGSVMIRAAKNNIIKKIGHSTVTNPTAHACFASRWCKY